jgi:8-oxo-dGTP diphosphatase
MKCWYARFIKLIFILTRPLSALVLHNSRRVRIVVTTKDSVLLVRSSFGRQLWSFPGGGIEKNEDPLHAAARELKEETNLQLEETQIKYSGEARIPSGKKYPMINMVFHSASLSSTEPVRVIRPFEMLEVKWFKLSELPSKRSKSVDIGLQMLKNR